MCFNPLPSPKQGETLQNVMGKASTVVSIRSPHRSKGRQSKYLVGWPSGLFQSAPLTEARGDLIIRREKMATYVFQSAPLTEARGDSLLCWRLTKSHCFNPLPSPKQGETEANLSPYYEVVVSIRSPHRSKGRPK